ncbi:MAG: hypothetical protein PHO37_09805 [Kiritimatiellae bacterium]|nr:hypothetical protein [Kiritimatiellia bacterium]
MEIKDYDYDPWFLPSSSIPGGLGYKYGTTWWEDGACGFRNWGAVFNNVLHGVTDETINLISSMEVNINDPMAPHLKHVSE